MYRRYLAGILVLFVAIFFIYLIIHSITGGSKPKAPIEAISLPSYATTDTVMQFTIYGPVTYSDTHREIRITIGQNENAIAILQGYQGNVIKSNTYPSNEAAYNTFLHALVLAGFTKSRSIAGSSVGACATGNLYYSQILDDFGNYVQSLWGSSCNEGSFAGSVQLVENLFQAQIPDYSTQTAGVNID